MGLFDLLEWGLEKTLELPETIFNAADEIMDSPTRTPEILLDEITQALREAFEELKED